MLFRLIKLTAILIQVILLLTLKSEFSFSLTKEEELEIQKIISATVCNTSWLYSPSQEDLIILFKPFFAGEYCRETVSSVWNFINNPTGWEYLYFLGDIKIEGDTGGEGQENNITVHAVIIEYDPLFSFFNSYNLDFDLIKIESEWKIKNIKQPVPYNVQ